MAQRAKAHSSCYQDGASFHRSKAVQEYWQQWQEMGLFIFFFPPKVTQES
jgi:murein tripeptide amidase MpaA